MCNLKTITLKISLIEAVIWLSLLLSGLLSLNIYRYSPQWRLVILVGCGVAVLGYILHQVRIKYSIGIEESGVFLLKRKSRYGLKFVRVNAFQLIAEVIPLDGKENRLWKRYFVIYRDSVDYPSYQQLRSYGAQQMLMRQYEKKP